MTARLLGVQVPFGAMHLHHGARPAPPARDRTRWAERFRASVQPGRQAPQHPSERPVRLDPLTLVPIPTLRAVAALGSVQIGTPGKRSLVAVSRSSRRCIPAMPVWLETASLTAQPASGSVRIWRAEAVHVRSSRLSGTLVRHGHRLASCAKRNLRTSADEVHGARQRAPASTTWRSKRRSRRVRPLTSACSACGTSQSVPIPDHVASRRSDAARRSRDGAGSGPALLSAIAAERHGSAPAAGRPWRGVGSSGRSYSDDDTERGGPSGVRGPRTRPGRGRGDRGALLVQWPRSICPSGYLLLPEAQARAPGCVERGQS